VEIIQLRTGFEDYWKLPQLVRDRGQQCAPRGQTTWDLGPTTLVFKSADNALPIGCGRRVNSHIAAAEAIQLIGGFGDPALTVWSSDAFRAFQEDDGTFHGAYGDRIGDQLNDVVNKLRRDPDTRQAVITLWDPKKDSALGAKRDYPCTVSLGFRLVNQGQPVLELNTLMRSNDVWLGTPYDIFQFTQLQHTVATILGVKTGKYRHTAWSFHLYAQHESLLTQLRAPKGAPDQPKGLARPGDLVSEMRLRAHDIVYDQTCDDLRLGYVGAQWYFNELAPFRDERR
jgi:thymidylate synthase